MKNVVITFALAIVVIGAAVAYNSLAAENEVANYKQTRTVVVNDNTGRVIEVLTKEVDGEKWVETKKQAMTYADGKVETVSYLKEDGDWSPVEKVVSYLCKGNVLSATHYTLEGGVWNVGRVDDYADLSANSDVVDDMVFDKDGNLVMKSTYLWDGNAKKGVSREDYEYANGKCSRSISYVWNNGTWEKTVVSDILIARN